LGTAIPWGFTPLSKLVIIYRVWIIKNQLINLCTGLILGPLENSYRPQGGYENTKHRALNN
jgi:hypothetical protein